MGGVEEVGFQELVGTVDLESPAYMCNKVLALVREMIMHEHAGVQSSSDDDVAIYTPKGEHVGTKRKVCYTRALVKTGGTKGGGKEEDKRGASHGIDIWHDKVRKSPTRWVEGAYSAKGSGA